MITVLIADDSADNREILTDFLSDEGYAIATAANAFEAVEVARASVPALILMDLQMPAAPDRPQRLDDAGLTATRALRADAKTAAIPIIAVTGFDSPARRADIEAAGCDGVARKPYEFAQLLEDIRRLTSSP